MAGQTHIPFHVPFRSHHEKGELEYLLVENDFAASRAQREAADKLETLTGKNVELTTSCTHALEMALMLLDLSPEDEVIVPSFTFMSVPNAVFRAGGRVVFADIDPESMNMSAESLEERITGRTKAVIYMHYAGLSYDFDDIVGLCENHGIVLIEDAAHALSAQRNGQHLGTFKDFGTLSFHHTKNIHCGEGGALLFREEYRSKVEMITEKGTDKRAFLRGEVPCYDWQTIGSSFSMSAVAAAFLNGQLKSVEEVTRLRKERWKEYWHQLESLQEYVGLPERTAIEEGNGHIFFIKAKDEEQRASLTTYLKEKGVSAYFHYPALHESPASLQYCRDIRPCPLASAESRKLLRLPIYSDLAMSDLHYVTEAIRDFYSG